jgi:hypothetical protein
MEPAEFCSDAWVDNARTILGDLMAEYGPQIAGQQHSLVECFARPPAHPRHGGEDRVLWSFVVEAARLTLHAPACTASRMQRGLRHGHGIA